MNNETQHTPADMQERIKATISEGVRYVAKADGAYLYEPSVDETADRILSLLRTPRGEREGVTGAWATVEAAALAQANMLDSHYVGQPSRAAEIRNAVEQVAAFLRTPRGEGEDTIPVSALRSEIALLRKHRLLPYLAWARLCALAGGEPVGEDSPAARQGEGGGDG